MKSFEGDLSWIHAREGHNGAPYWPGGASGVTLDPGFDVGHAKVSLLESAFADVLSAAEMATVKEACGIKGDDARKYLVANSDLSKIRISRKEADAVFPVVATPYWEDICKRYPTLPEAPGSVQTALLSIAFNRGARNHRLSVLDGALRTRDWYVVGTIIGEMQQDHSLEGIRKRRRMEADLIREGVSAPSSNALDSAAGIAKSVGNIVDTVNAIEDAVEILKSFDLDTIKGKQAALAHLGYPVGAADGIWGANSIKSLRMFQEEWDLAADGLWGPNSKAAMEKTLAQG